MVTPRRYCDYPPEYTELFLRAVLRPIRIPFLTLQQAKQTRDHLYAFRTAIRNSREGDGVPDRLMLIAALLSFHIEGTELLVHKPNRIVNLQKSLELLQNE